MCLVPGNVCLIIARSVRLGHFPACNHQRPQCAALDSPFSSVIPAPAKAASVLTMEIMGYATLSAGRQHAGKYALRQVLKTHEKIPPSLRPQLRDTPTGVQMVFLSSPAHTCLFALSVLQALGADEPLQPAPLKLSDLHCVF